jgi:hypothetical protein
MGQACGSYHRAPGPPDGDEQEVKVDRVSTRRKRFESEMMMTNRLHVVAVVMVIGGVQDVLMDEG